MLYIIHKHTHIIYITGVSTVYYRAHLENSHYLEQLLSPLHLTSLNMAFHNCGKILAVLSEAISLEYVSFIQFLVALSQVRDLSRLLPKLLQK